MYKKMNIVCDYVKKSVNKGTFFKKNIICAKRLRIKIISLWMQID